MKLSETNGAQYWVLLGSNPSQASLSQAHSEEHWVPAWHWQPPCHFRAELSPVSCSHDFVLTQMAPSVGLSSRRRSHWFLQIYQYVTNIFTCLDSELNYVVVLVIQRYFQLCGTSATTSKYAVIHYWHLTFLGEGFTLALYSPYTFLVVLVFFGCLLSLLGDIYPTASSSSVKFGLLQTMSRFVHISSCPFPPCGLAQLCETLYWRGSALCTLLLTCFHLVVCYTAQGMVKRLCFCFHASWAVVKPSD